MVTNVFKIQTKTTENKTLTLKGEKGKGGNGKKLFKRKNIMKVVKLAWCEEKKGNKEKLCNEVTFQSATLRSGHSRGKAGEGEGKGRE